MLHDWLNRTPMSSNMHGDPHTWSLRIGVTLVLIAVALVYLRGWYQLRSALPHLVSGWRLAAFMSGVLALWVAVGSTLAIMDDQFLTFNMVQHLLLMTVAAPLILLGLR